jgi:DNA repair exonuclease SbcCD ATPase subunit
MITLKSLSWSNWFSYGADNYINLEEAPLMQISGKNGTGKSSIPLIIEEVLYGKNHVGKRKQTLVNRYLDKPVLSAELIFSKDDVDYKVKLSRKGTVKIQFFKGNEDLSSHTSTNTYKTIQEVLGIEFKVFVQLIYQSAKMNLEFLEATDTNRKKFLISLFKLDKYLEIHNIFKKVESDIGTEVAVLQGKLSTIEAWINKHISEDLIPDKMSEVPEMNKDDIDELTVQKSKLLNIKDTNSKINKNNQYKELLKRVDMSKLSYSEVVPDDKAEKENEKRKAQHKVTENKTKLNIHKTNIKKIRSLADKCPTCSHNISEEFKDNLVTKQNVKILDIESILIATDKEIKEIETTLKDYRQIELKVNERAKASDDFSTLQNLIDNSIPTNIVIESDIIKSVGELETRLRNITENIKNITATNSRADIKNSRIKVITEQLNEYKGQAEDIREQLFNIEEQQGKLSILKKAFSTNGLLNYKLDYLIKDLEQQINFYLQELSSGKFQIVFVLQDEKLNIEILDEGITVSIEEVSAGELARINTATLLAIRKLMSAISSTKLNILFLDEVLGVLDDEGKEKLIEVLLNEKDLNTFLVSHEYENPLIPKINIVKEGKISRISNEI